jgi:hypothetical protein
LSLQCELLETFIHQKKTIRVQTTPKTTNEN